MEKEAKIHVAWARGCLGRLKSLDNQSYTVIIWNLFFRSLRYAYLTRCADKHVQRA